MVLKDRGYGGGQAGFARLDVPHRGYGGMMCCLAAHQMARRASPAWMSPTGGMGEATPTVT